jgi:hypothetical protein
MRRKKGKPDPEKIAEVLASAKRGREDRADGYRERALALFPPVCGRCGREFEGKSLRELTVHHKDHNHNNNPPDGSNWELLCLYCHDNEHQDPDHRDAYDGSGSLTATETSLTSNPFEALGNMITPEDDSAPE